MAIDRQDTKNRVIKIIAEQLKIDQNAIDETKTLQDLGADSLDQVEIILKLEEEFSISINDEDAEKLNNLKDAIDYVQKLRSK